MLNIQLTLQKLVQLDTEPNKDMLSFAPVSEEETEKNKTQKVLFMENQPIK